MIRKITKQIWKGVNSPGTTLNKLGLREFNIDSIPVANILRSGETNIPAKQYARLIENPLRASQKIIDGPQVKLLQEYKKHGREIFENAFFENTEYYKNAAECLSYTGEYFPHIRQRSHIVEAAKDFIDAVEGKRPRNHTQQNSHNQPDDLIEVQQIRDSSFYQLISGNHRTASAYMRGENRLKARIYLAPVTTPAQDMLRDVLWQSGRVELYQPVDLPEVSEWPILRQCFDRLKLIKSFLSEKNIKQGAYVDIGSSYGWFVREFLHGGYDAHGVERDSFAIKIGCNLYGVPKERFFRSDIVDYLAGANKPVDIVSCFSVAHHFALGRGSISIEEIVTLLGKLTGKILFFDTGEAHEEWFKKTLSRWNPDYIENFLKTNGKFTQVVRLGKDQDNRGNYAANYGRTLFACLRG